MKGGGAKQVEFGGGHQVQPRQIAQHRSIRRGHAAQHAPLPRLHFGQRHERLLINRAVRGRDGVAVGAVGGVAAEQLHAALKGGAKRMLHAVRLAFDLIPRKAHYLDQKNFEQPVSAQHLQRGQPPLIGQRNAVRRRAHGVARLLQPLQHAARRRCGYVHLFRQRRSRHPIVVARQLVNSDEIIQHPVGNHPAKRLHVAPRQSSTLLPIVFVKNFISIKIYYKSWAICCQFTKL